ncbi:MAG: STN domain-containing protein [Verrucomicrobiota bacterium]
MSFTLKASAAAFVLIAGILSTLLFKEEGARDFELPAGNAAQTLKQFAKQAEVEIIFNADSVKGVQTNAVRGAMSPRLALEAMVKGTLLAVDQDRETGAYAIIGQTIDKATPTSPPSTNPPSESELHRQSSI